MKNIQDVLQAYFNAWNEGFISKSSTKIREFMSLDFNGYWAHSGLDVPDTYGSDYDIVSVLESMDNATKHFTAYSTVLRKNGTEYLITGKITSIIKGTTHTAQCIYVWRLTDGNWKLIREYIELEK